MTEKIIDLFVDYEYTILRVVDILLTLGLGYMVSPMFYWLLVFEIPLFITMYRNKL